MKTLIAAFFALLLVQTTFAAGPIPEAKIKQRFSQTFPNASNVKWAETDKQYEVRFADGKINCWLILNKSNGSTYALVRYYGETELAPAVKEALYESYPETQIQGVTEINMDDRKVYQVNLEGKNNWYIVRVDDHLNIHEKDIFKKAL